MNEQKQEQIEHRCFRCNHRLTKPESIQQGLGPVCVIKQIHEMVVNKMTALRGTLRYFGKGRR